jgi:hypothetical protein
MKAGKTFEGRAAEVSAQIGNRINSDLVSLSKDKHMRQMMIIRCARTFASCANVSMTSKMLQLSRK